MSPQPLTSTTSRPTGPAQQETTPCPHHARRRRRFADRPLDEPRRDLEPRLAQSDATAAPALKQGPGPTRASRPSSSPRRSAARASRKCRSRSPSSTRPSWNAPASRTSATWPRRRPRWNSATRIDQRPRRQRLDPRHRHRRVHAVGRELGRRGGRRRAAGRDRQRPDAGPGARRSAARPAGHAVRQERLGRRAEHGDPGTDDRRNRRQRPARIQGRPWRRACAPPATSR
jgi:hypothetical protein